MDKKISIEEVSYLPEEQKLLETKSAEQISQSTSKKIENQSPIKEEKPLLVLITGGAAAGKSTLTKQLKEHLEQEVLILPLDNYYAYSPLLFQSRNPILHEIFQ